LNALIHRVGPTSANRRYRNYALFFPRSHEQKAQAYDNAIYRQRPASVGYDLFMATISSEFTTLEKAVLDAICSANPGEKTLLEQQFAAATIVSRDNTRAGFYTDFRVDRTSSSPVQGDRRRTGPSANVEGLQHGMGFVLWITDGFADCLEGYSYDESTSEIAFDRTAFEILREVNDER
jgi:hypothetical protein